MLDFANYNLQNSNISHKSSQKQYINLVFLKISLLLIMKTIMEVIILLL